MNGRGLIINILLQLATGFGEDLLKFPCWRPIGFYFKGYSIIFLIVKPLSANSTKWSSWIHVYKNLSLEPIPLHKVFNDSFSKGKISYEWNTVRKHYLRRNECSYSLTKICLRIKNVVLSLSFVRTFQKKDLILYFWSILIRCHRIVRKN